MRCAAGRVVVRVCAVMCWVLRMLIQAVVCPATVVDQAKLGS